jgi:hypothetical protein
MHELFDICVDVLFWIANVFGITYKEANIWVFVIVEPVVFILMLGLILRQRTRIKVLEAITQQ